MNVRTRPRASTGTSRRHGLRHRMNTCAGGLIVLYGSAHTIGAFAGLGAARHASIWVTGQLWADDLANMSPAMSAYWLTVNSFAPPLIVLGATVLWLDRRDITPPPFIAWMLAVWVVVDTLLSGPGVGQWLIILAAAGLLFAAAHGADDRERIAA